MSILVGPHIRTWTEASVGYVQIDRPTKANAYTDSMLELIARGLDELERSGSLSVIVFTGSGSRVFCAGADLTEIRQRQSSDARELRSAALFARIARSPKITLAAINGDAVGGGLELALACDLRVCVPEARFSLPETGLGLIPAAGGTQRLPSTVGLGAAKELILGGRVWTAEDALRVGLISEIVLADNLMEFSQAWGQRIAARNALALQMAKKAVGAAFEHGSGFELEAAFEGLLYGIEDK